MSITTLTKFTVPSADTATAAQGMLMPKLKYRFRVTLLGFGVAAATELTKQVSDVTRPKVSFEEMPLDVYNSKVYLAGKYSFETITLTLRDDASGQVQALVGQQIQKQFDFMEQSSASSGIDYKFLTRFEVLDGGNGANEATVLETWELYGCYLSNTDYADANYATNEPMTVALTIRYDNAIQTPGGTGIGTAVGRTLGTTITG